MSTNKDTQKPGSTGGDQRKEAPSAGKLDGVIVLRLSNATNSSNLLEFTPQIQALFLERFGDDGDFITEGAYHQYADPTPMDFGLDEEEILAAMDRPRSQGSATRASATERLSRVEALDVIDPYGTKRLRLKKATELAETRKATLETQKPKMYGLLWRYLSAPSQNAIRQLPEADIRQIGRDPLLLWRAVKKTHSLVNAPIANMEGRKLQARHELHTIEQGRHESVRSFIERYKHVHDVYCELHADGARPEEERVADVIRALDDSRYHEWKWHYLNSINTGARDPIKTILGLENDLLDFIPPPGSNVKQSAHNPFGAFMTRPKSEPSAGSDRDNNSGKHNNQKSSQQRGRGGGDNKAAKKGNNKQGGGGGGGAGGDKQQQQCAACGKTDHKLPKCPVLAKARESAGLGKMSDTAAAATGAAAGAGEKRGNFSAVPVLSTAAATGGNGDSDTEYNGYDTDDEQGVLDRPSIKLMLDSCAGITSIDPQIAVDVEHLEEPIEITAYGGATVSVDRVGRLPDFEKLGKICVLPGPSLLCFADVKDLYGTVEHSTGWRVTGDSGRVYNFQRMRDKTHATIYVSTPSTATTTHSPTSVTAVERTLSKAQLARINEAREFIDNSAATSLSDALNYVRDGNVNGISVSADELKMAWNLRQHPAVEKGTTTRPPEIARPTIDHELLSGQQLQRVQIDTFYVARHPFLMAAAKPSCVVLAPELKSETTDAVAVAMQSVKEFFASYNKPVELFEVESEPKMRGLQGRFQSTRVEIGGAGDHLPDADAAIRRIKEIVRVTAHMLAFNLPDEWVADLVTYAVTRRNAKGLSTMGDRVAPKVRLTGRKIDAKTEFGLKFGDYAEVYNHAVVSNDALQARTVSCIAMYPTNTGSWVFTNLATGRRITRSRWKRLPMAQWVINRVNVLAAKKAAALEAEEAAAAAVDDADIAADPLPPLSDLRDDSSEEVEAATAAAAAAAAASDDDEDLPPNLVEDDDSSDDDGDDDEPAPQTVDPDGGAEQQPRYPARSNRGVRGNNLAESDWHVVMPKKLQRKLKALLATSDYSDERVAKVEAKMVQLVINHITARKGFKQFGRDAIESALREVRNLWLPKDRGGKEALEPVLRANLAYEELKKILRSSLFFKEKFDAAGLFEKLKARLVANGAQQDRDLYPDRSSPTAPLWALICVLALAAREKREMVAIDIGQAYLEAPMDGDEHVYIEVDPIVTAVVAKEEPSLRPFVDDKGKLLFKVKKALSPVF